MLRIHLCHLISLSSGTMLYFQLFCELVLLTLLNDGVVGQQIPIRITGDDIQQIVGAHNLFRGMVDPTASNMQQVEWNAALAMVAQGYAEMCMFGPNPNRTEQAGRAFDSVGENRAFGRTTNYTDLIERGWFVQRTNYDFSSNVCLSPGACNEYTQLVWAESNMVGCGVANCPTVVGLPILPNAVVFVCNYAPEGNIPGERPYMTGEPCTSCPPTLPLCNENVCSSTDNVTTTTVTTITTAQLPVIFSSTETLVVIPTATPELIIINPDNDESSQSESSDSDSDRS